MVTENPLQRARRIAPVFSGEQLRRLRELQRIPQKELASRVGITASALSQAESNDTKPTPENLVKLADELGVHIEAFASKPSTQPLPNPLFRHLRRTPLAERRRAMRFVQVIAEVVKNLGSRVELPQLVHIPSSVDPGAPAQEAGGDIERLAVSARVALGMSRTEPFDEHGPIPVLEDKGLIVVRDPDLTDTIDAFSAPVDGHAVTVLTGIPSTSWDRDDFNVAHEFGHCVMHRGAEPGRQTIEDQAHRFAGAFLAPADAIHDELPVTLDWSRYMDLKYKWGLSIAALVRRARDLEVIDGDTYVRAMKHRARYGWRRIEPGNNARPLVQPDLLRDALNRSGFSEADLSDRIGVPLLIIKTIVGSR